MQRQARAALRGNKRGRTRVALPAVARALGVGDHGSLHRNTFIPLGHSFVRAGEPTVTRTFPLSITNSENAQNNRLTQKRGGKFISTTIETEKGKGNIFVGIFEGMYDFITFTFSLLTAS